MADSMDDDDQQPVGLSSDLLTPIQAQGAMPGLSAALMSPPVLAPPAIGAQTPVAIAQPMPRVPGYTDSRNHTSFVPLLPNVSPAAFAAQQQSPVENSWSGYGAETRNFGREAMDLGGRLVLAGQGNPAAFLLPATTDPDKDIQSGLFKTSLAANLGRMGADFANTYPIAGGAGELAAPLAASIRGESLLPTMVRAAIPGVAKGVAAGAAIPADDPDDRVYHVLMRGVLGTGYGLMPVAKTLIDY